MVRWSIRAIIGAIASIDASCLGCQSESDWVISEVPVLKLGTRLGDKVGVGQSVPTA